MFLLAVFDQTRLLCSDSKRLQLEGDTRRQTYASRYHLILQITELAVQFCVFNREEHLMELQSGMTQQ